MGREHWVEVPLCNLLTSLESGSRPKGGVKGIQAGIPSIGAEHLSNDGSFDFTNIRFIPESFARGMRRGILAKNDILIVKDGATTGKTSFVSDSFLFEFACINEHVFICRLINAISPKYIFHFLRSHEGQNMIMSTFHGGAQGGINSEFVDAVTVPLPPLNEQQRIVAKLDALLPKVKHAQARLAKIPGLVKKFRQSVLAAACSGRLTEEFRQSDGYSDEDIPISWNRSFLPKMLESKPKNGYSGKPVKYETNTKVLSLTATTSGVFNDQYFKYLDEVIPEDSPFWVKTNDILIQRGNTLEYVGVPAIYKGKGNRFIYSDLMIRLVADKKLLMPDYLYYYLSWEKIRNFMRNNASGTAGSMPKINQRVLEKIIVFLPPLEEQHEIVRRVEKLFALAASLEAKYSKAMQRVTKIEQALLAKAFRGELAPPDPQDEPAEVLLQRILAEKAKSEAGPKTRKTKKKQSHR